MIFCGFITGSIVWLLAGLATSPNYATHQMSCLISLELHIYYVYNKAVEILFTSKANKVIYRKYRKQWFGLVCNARTYYSNK
jgi:hypothetical protein